MLFRVVTIFLLFSCQISAGELSNWLKLNNPDNYFPENASYREYPVACNNLSCFHIISVSYATPTNKGMNRIAVFSESNDYLGVYSGFSDLPIDVTGYTLIFPISEHGHTLSFSGTSPPPTAYIDGEHFKFESKLE